MKASNRVRVILADDHPIVAEQLRSLLESEFVVLAVVGDGRDLVDAFILHRPDVVVSDIAMPVLDGIAATREIRSHDANARIVLVTVLNDAAVATQAFAVGALGYVSKMSAGEELLSAVNAAQRGQRYVSPSVDFEVESVTSSLT